MYLSTFCALVGIASAFPEKDAVDALPGYGPPPAPQYSGFLNASSAEAGTYLHYWFAASSATDWKRKPVVLWLNGGPGSSSIIGMLQEQGPLLIDHTGKLMDNPYAWTTVANLVVLESPAGVGYSYCEAMLKGGSCANTDISTAKAAYAALLDFFAKFPELSTNEFFITGESYAGVYCPTLADQVVQGNAQAGPRINLVGMAVGDPCTDNKAQAQSMDMLWYAHKNSLVPDEEFDFLWNTCGMRAPSMMAAGSWRAKSALRVAKSSPSQQAGKLAEGMSINCTVAYRKFLLSSSKGLSQSWDKAFVNELSLFSPAAPFRFDLPGTLNYNTAQWMMLPETRKALHLEAAPVKAWPGPADGWSYTSSYAACNGDAPPGTKSMVDFYRELAPALPGKIVVYNGDTDPCVSYEGTRTAIKQVGFAEVQPYRPWFFNYTAATDGILQRKDILFGPSLSPLGAGSQYGGEIVDYQHGLSFATVHGSGHMVPTFRPRAALQLLAHVIANSSFAPSVPDAHQLGTMTDADFAKFLDKWVVDAESSAFVGM